MPDKFKRSTFIAYVSVWPQFQISAASDELEEGPVSQQTPCSFDAEAEAEAPKRTARKQVSKSHGIMRVHSPCEQADTISALLPDLTI
jgi:hypothetical protein